MDMYLEDLDDLFEFKTVLLVASDIDGTLTQGRYLSPEAIRQLHKMHEYGLQVLLVTGRSAGWGHALAGYLPVAGVIAENGGVFISAGAHDPPRVLLPRADCEDLRIRLRECFRKIKEVFPAVQETGDNCFRMSDWTFEVAGRTQRELQQIGELCKQEGWAFTFSTIHCHIMDNRLDKAKGIVMGIKSLENTKAISLDKVVTIGDSPNDSPMFNPQIFPCSVGVRNIGAYLEMMEYKPKYISRYSEADGFISLVKQIIMAKK